MIGMTRDEKKHYDELMASGDVEALKEYLRVLEQIQKTTKQLMQTSDEDKIPTYRESIKEACKNFSDSCMAAVDHIIKEIRENA